MQISRPQFLTIAWLLAIGVFAIVVHVVQFTFVTTLVRSLIGSLHGPGFGLIALSFMLALRTWLSPSVAYGLAGVLSLGLGTLTELLQFIGPRDADPIDLVHDAVGIVGFLGIAALLDKPLQSRLPHFSSVKARLWVSIIFLASVYHTGWYAYAAVSQYRSFPQILTFDNLWERATFRAPWRMHYALVPAPAETGMSNGNAALLSFQPKLTSGFEITPYPDWQGYESVSFVAMSSATRSAQLSITFRDRYFTRKNRHQFQRIVPVGTEPSRVFIRIADLGKGDDVGGLDVSAITSFTIALANAVEGDSVIIDDIRLE